MLAPRNVRIPQILSSQLAKECVSLVRTKAVNIRVIKKNGEGERRGKRERKRKRGEERERERERDRGIWKLTGSGMVEMNVGWNTNNGVSCFAVLPGYNAIVDLVVYIFLW